MTDALTILSHLEALRSSIDIDRADLERITMTPEVRVRIQHQVARCFHSLRELEIVLEANAAEEAPEEDFPV